MVYRSREARDIQRARGIKERADEDDPLDGHHSLFLFCQYHSEVKLLREQLLWLITIRRTTGFRVQ